MSDQFDKIMIAIKDTSLAFDECMKHKNAEITRLQLDKEQAKKAYDNLHQEAAKMSEENQTLRTKLERVTEALKEAGIGFEQMRDCKYEPDKLLCVQQRHSQKVKMALQDEGKERA